MPRYALKLPRISLISGVQAGVHVRMDIRLGNEGVLTLGTNERSENPGKKIERPV